MEPSIEDSTAAHYIYQLVFDTEGITKYGKNSGFGTTTNSDPNPFYRFLHDLRRADHPNEAPTQPYVRQTQASQNLDTQDSSQASQSQSIAGSPSYGPFNEESTCVVVFRYLLLHLFEKSWDAFDQSAKSLVNSKTLTEFLSHMRTATSTKNTAMDVDELNLPENKTLQELVKRAVTSETLSLQQQIKSLRQRQQHSKNPTRGATTSRASTKKKNDATPPQEPTNNRNKNKPNKKRPKQKTGNPNAAADAPANDKPPPPRFTSLLGLGLKFCPTPTYTTDSDKVEGTIARFRQDFLTKIIFTNQRFDPTDEWDPKQLHIRSQDWTPKESDVNNEVTTRLHAFTDTIRPWFKKKKASRNLSLTQGRLLAEFRNNRDFLVVPSDKNLGPVIMERDEYVRRCFTDHMLKNTYQQFVDQTAATSYIDETKSKLSDFLRNHGAIMSKHDKTYLDRYIETVTDPFSYFYALIKIHKDPWQTRPIVSGSGSILHGLGKWLDRQLQPFIKSLPTYLPSSYKLKDDLDSFRGRSLSRMRLFTGDIIAMYPSIELNDAFTKIESFLSTHPDCTEELCDAIMTALDLIMRRNCFKFGDTYWLQTDGTAMGVPPAPPFATLYYGIYELELVEEFQSELFYLKRYIDDQFGIWICDPDPTVDNARWLAFQNRQQSFCSLNWEFSPLSSTVNFLDLSINLRSHSFVTTLYEKPMNLHLYIPWHSAHTPAVRSSFIHSGIHRIFKLVSELSEHIRLLSLFFSRLLARGYPHDFLYDLFRKALHKHSESPKPPPAIGYHYQMTIPDRYTRIFIHLPYHQQDPPRRRIQHAFQSKIYQPINRYTDRLYHRILHYDAGEFGLVFDSTTDTWIRVEPSFVQRAHVEPKLDDLRNEQRNHYAINRLVIAYHRAPNLKNLLFPQHVEAKCPTTPSASTILSTLQPAPDAPPL